jgi:predicted DsbA family dithiol-disulfide isomerase
MTTIEVFADIACPFTHVGLRRFVQRREELGRPDVTLLVRAWPLEVVNGQPLDPAATADKVAALRDQVAPDLFTGFDPEAFPSTTLPALALAHAAYAVDARTGERVSLALRDLLFERGADVTDPAVLQALADEHGVTFDPEDRSAVLADHAEGADRGVVGSPHFFTEGGGFFCPSLDIGHDADGQLEIAVDADGLDGFLAACFA